MGAVMPVKRRAPVKVVVFQWPCGTGERHRIPRLARPRSRAIFVEAPVSSMNTRCVGSRSGCASNQARRRAATSGRSCSLACAVFFDGNGMAVEKSPHRARGKAGAMFLPQQRRQFDESDIHLALDRRQDDVAIGFNAMRSPVATLLPRARRASLTPFPNPTHRACRSDTKSCRSRSARQATFNCRDYASPQVLRQGFSQACWPPRPAHRVNQIFQLRESPVILSGRILL